MRHLFLLFGLLCVVERSLVRAQEDNATAAEGDSSTSGSSTTTWNGCGSSKVTIGQPTTVCLQIGNTNAWNQGAEYIRLSFTPTADEYSRFYVKNSYKDLINNDKDTIWKGKNITVGVASQTALSFLRLYHDSEAFRVYPFLTAIIDVHMGTIASIQWDDACVFCAKGQCDEITYDFDGNLQTNLGQPTGGCSFDQQKECNVWKESPEGKHPCDVALYVVWTGKDANGIPLQSSANRFSAFPPQSIQDRVSQLLPEIDYNPFDRRRMMQEQQAAVEYEI